MACPPSAGCPRITDSLCKPLPPLLIDPTPDELRLMQFYWYQGRNRNPCPYLPILQNPTGNETLLRYYLFLIGCADDPPPLLEFGTPNLNLLARRPAGANRAAGPGGIGIVVPVPPLVITGTPTIDCGIATPSFTLVASGGQPPYTWSALSALCGATGLAQSGPGNNTVVVTPPSNPSPTTAGTAYKLWTCIDNCALITPFCTIAVANYNCDDTKGSFDPSCRSSGTFCPGCVGATCGGGPTCGSGLCDGCQGTDVLVQTCGSFCDERTGLMIAAGCEPCGVCMDGEVITVTDNIGTQVSVVTFVTNSL